MARGFEFQELSAVFHCFLCCATCAYTSEQKVSIVSGIRVRRAQL
jgi:hypothetical protein